MAGAVTTWFDNRLKFNAEAFSRYMEQMPRTKTYAFINSGIVRRDANIISAFSSQTGAYSQRMPIYGEASADETNYDGNTSMGEPGYQDSYSRAVIAYGRQFALAEKDFSYDLIPGADFGAVLRNHIGINRDNKFEKRILDITNALFSFKDEDGEEGEPDADPSAEVNFATTHTMDISSLSGGSEVIGDTTLNDAIQKASREFKSDYTMIAVHSQVATNLENKKLVQYAKGVDAEGVIRDLSIPTWNGKMLIIDDSLPVSADGKYTSYIFGRGMFSYADLPVTTPYEPVRDPDLAIDKMYVRYREVIAPMGFSFEGTPTSLSPTDTELADYKNWKLADNGKTGEDRKTYPIERIPLARIISKG